MLRFVVVKLYEFDAKFYFIDSHPFFNLTMFSIIPCREKYFTKHKHVLVYSFSFLFAEVEMITKPRKRHIYTSYPIEWVGDAKRQKISWHAIDLTHWGRVTHICVSKLTIIGSDNGLSPGRRQAIIWTNAEILLIRTWGTNFSEILGQIDSFSFSKMHLKMSSAKWCLFGLGLNELIHTEYSGFSSHEKDFQIQISNQCNYLSAM